MVCDLICVVFGWTELCCAGLDWAGLGWAVLSCGCGCACGWAGLGWAVAVQVAGLG